MKIEVFWNANKLEGSLDLRNKVKWGHTRSNRVKNIFLADLESNLDDLFQIECDAANAMMKIRFGPTPTRFCTQKGASCDPKKVG